MDNGQWRMDNDRGFQNFRFRCEHSAFYIPHSAFGQVAHANAACFCIGVARLRNYRASGATGAVEDRGIDVAHNVSYGIGLRDVASRRRRRHFCDYNGAVFGDDFSSQTWMKRPYLRVML